MACDPFLGHAKPQVHRNADKFKPSHSGYGSAAREAMAPQRLLQSDQEKSSMVPARVGKTTLPRAPPGSRSRGWDPAKLLI